MRLPSVSQIEGATLSAWPALRIVHDGLWLWRYGRGYTKRANSIHCLDPSDGADAELRLNRLVALSEQFGIVPTFRVTPLTAPQIVFVLDGLQWDEFDQSLVLARPIPDEDFPLEAQVKYFDPADPDWYRAQAQMAGYDQETVKTLREILDLIACPAQGVLVYHKAGVPVAAALSVVAGGIAVFLNVVTYPNARGMGYGRIAMSAAINSVRAAGAQYCTLQVLAGNDPALALYTSLGFGEAYRYAYRRPGDWSSQ
ncbi:MAG: GNAT family N-acetyltransferase [Devosia nanyangense]|uniref:GNAT family N-acetyltransferase n=1 Tax=Devosia nanyangense TaxID=1228055 RepID=A0A933P0J0_9HYPH|nr:GNAT family N-acetyltransferase [Devosia nanyangense]